jgi:RsmE family RNA methyltransferase
MQSRRPWLPEVNGPTEASVLAAAPGAALCEPGGGPPSLERPVLLVGPEGGWSQRELGPTMGIVGLGPQILRVETAALSAAALLVALRSGLVTPTPIVVNDAVRG